MDQIAAIGRQYESRAKLFADFIKAFKGRGPTVFPSLSFEEKDESEPDVVTFRYLGRRLRIRHSFAVEGHPEVFQMDEPVQRSIVRMGATLGETVVRVRSELKLVKAKNDPDNECKPVGSIFIDGEGHMETETLPGTWTIVDNPERAFQELLAMWLGPKETESRQ